MTPFQSAGETATGLDALVAGLVEADPKFDIEKFWRELRLQVERRLALLHRQRWPGKPQRGRPATQATPEEPHVS